MLLSSGLDRAYNLEHGSDIGIASPGQIDRKSGKVGKFNPAFA